MYALGFFPAPVLRNCAAALNHMAVIRRIEYHTDSLDNDATWKVSALDVCTPKLKKK